MSSAARGDTSRAPGLSSASARGPPKLHVAKTSTRRSMMKILAAPLMILVARLRRCGRSMATGRPRPTRDPAGGSGVPVHQPTCAGIWLPIDFIVKIVE